MKKNYLVFYTKECTPHIKEFSSLTKAQKFCGTLKVDHTDTWIDFIVAGEIVDEFPGAEGIVRE